MSRESEVSRKVKETLSGLMRLGLIERGKAREARFESLEAFWDGYVTALKDLADLLEIHNDVEEARWSSAL